ncbi:MAG: hypothetical protein J0M24_13175 [Verrucomicrobia bacterium]|nr:hypothetical protein [Verrucomicrobiota bacterium]
MNARQFLLLAVVLLLGSGCSISREWKAANQQPTHPRDITGAWIGTWQNSNNSHHDQLKAVITRVSETEYQARFKAWWLGIFSGTFKATLNGTWEGDEFVFAGSEKIMGWQFDQQGRVSATNFVSEYSSSDYRGTFTLKRPTPKEN